MKHLMRNWKMIGIALLALFPAGWSSGFQFASYTRSTLQDIIAEEQNHSFGQAAAEPQAGFIQLECQVAKYRILCRYSDIRRVISKNKSNVIRLWTETLNIDPKFASLYRQEIQVAEGLDLHWIPIQDQLLPHINQELVKNDMIELFIILTGKAGSEFVFIATEFKKSNSIDDKIIEATAFRLTAPRSPITVE
jgi:hypothetical protein